MLSSRNKRNLSDIVKKMKESREHVDRANANFGDPFYFDENEFIIEEKYDGERIQMHKDGNQYKWVSR